MPTASSGSEPTFPVDSYREAAPHLRRPFHPNAIKFKVQSQWPSGKKGEPPPTPKGALLVAYVDARLVSERLNAVCPHLWETRFDYYGDRIDTNKIICHLTIDGLTRSDVGAAQGMTDDVKVKAGYSDAFKRAAVPFGVGVSLYALPQWRLNAKKGGGEDEHGNPLLFVNTRDKIEMTPRVDKWLREMYGRWLEDVGEQHFGKPLHHGDVEDSVGDLLDGGLTPDDAEPDDLDLAAKRKEVEEAYAELPGTARRKMPRARFKTELSAKETASDLDAFLSEVRELADA